MNNKLPTDAGKGVIIAGRYGDLLCREKGGEKLELGELLVCKTDTDGMLLQVTDLSYGSQISQQNRELLSGLAMEDHVELTLTDSYLRTYTIASLKPLLTLPSMRPPKTLPPVFSPLHAVTEKDLRFETPQHALFLGNVRSGSKELALPVTINGKDALSHHVLIAATTGRGKSNLMKVLLQDLLEKDFASVLVFDPHAEYATALTGKKLAVYTKDANVGEFTLKIHLSALKPAHFDGVAEWTDAQREGLRLYHNKYREAWIEKVMTTEEPIKGILEGTHAVLKRRLSLLLSLEAEEGSLVCHGIFDTHAGRNTMQDIGERITNGGVIIVETASLSDAAEVLLATLITTECYERWKRTKPNKILAVCLEEAPRFIGDDVLKRGPNIFSQVAREGRKFNVGMIAITQLPSLIPRQVLSNMNTKIILGIEMVQERQAIIDSSPHDLSKDSRVIASLEKGEAIVSSIFTKFAIPIKVPLHKKKAASPSVVSGLKA